MARVLKVGVLFVLFWNSVALYGITDANQQREKPIKVLFVGNSLTHSNNLPQLVETGAIKMGVALEATMLAYPNYAIEDHWQERKVQHLLAQGNYDFLVLQQGPSSQDEGRQMLLDYGAKFKEVCKESNTRLVFFMVWPSLNYFRTFEQVIANYYEAAQFNNALLCPVGEVWKEHIGKSGDLSFYSADGFHPSQKGSLVAAQVIVETLLQEINKDGQR